MENEKELIPKPKSRFLKVKCPGCGSEQKIFGSASSNVRCVACNSELAKPGASKSKIKASIVEVLE